MAIVLFLPEQEQHNLIDFAAVIIINLTVSMIISVLFIPALLDKFPLYRRERRRIRRSRGKRRIVRWTRRYERFILWGRRRSLKWIFIILAVFAFGFPVHLLPAKLSYPHSPAKDSTRWVQFYNKTIGSPAYQQTLKPYVENIFGGSLRLFAKDVYSSDLYGEPERTQVIIRASLPEGCTVQQLNETLAEMENFLARFNEIDLFRTQINSYDNGSITVTFTPEAKSSGFAFLLKDMVTAQAIGSGGGRIGRSTGSAMRLTTA